MQEFYKEVESKDTWTYFGPLAVSFAIRARAWKKKNNKVTNDRNISFYYINTNEIQGELSRENRIFTCENNML